MPTIKGFHEKKGFRFFFTSHDRGEEPHIHAEDGSGLMKVRLKDFVIILCQSDNRESKCRKMN